jgi:hypothetical protein
VLRSELKARVIRDGALLYLQMGVLVGRIVAVIDRRGLHRFPVHVSNVEVFPADLVDWIRALVQKERVPIGSLPPSFRVEVDVWLPVHGRDGLCERGERSGNLFDLGGIETAANVELRTCLADFRSFPPRRTRPAFLLNAVLYVLKTGLRWRMLPSEFSPWRLRTTTFGNGGT